MTEHDETTIRLPHTGLRVPDRSLTVTAYKELITHDGVAFTANLRADRKIVGTIQNEGYGGPTGFYSHNPDVFGDAQVEQYAARCRTEEDHIVDYETLLNTLIDEHDWERKTRSADRRRQLLLRQMGHLMASDDEVYDGQPPYPQGDALYTAPATGAPKWAAIGAHLLKEAPLPDTYSWWQGWTGDRWIDLTARPASVSPDLYL